MKLLVMWAVAAVAAIAVAGCGSSSSGDATSDALSYLPKGAPLVFSLPTDPKDPQIEQANRLLGKFGPLASQFRQGFTQALRQRGLDFNKDVKPILGNRVFAAAPSAQSLNSGGNDFVVALKVGDEGKAKAIVGKGATKTASIDGADVYSQGGSFTAITGGALVSAPSRQLLSDALQRHKGGDSAHMTTDDYSRLLAGVKKDALLSVGVDIRALLAQSPRSAKARAVKWVDALRTGGVDIAAEPDGLALDFAAKTDGVSAADLPLAVGSQAPDLVRRASEIGFGIRGFPQAWAFGKGIAQATDPQGYAKFLADEGKANKQLGIDVEKDVVQQLSGDFIASVGLDGSYAVRSAPRDPAAFRATLAKYAQRATRVKSSGIRQVKRGPAGLYVVTGSSGKKAYAGMIGKNFVVAKDPARAQQFAAQPSTSVPGANGAFAIAFDAHTVADALADKRGVPQVKLFTGTLGDFVGSVESQTSGLRGSFKLTLK